MKIALGCLTLCLVASGLAQHLRDSATWRSVVLIVSTIVVGNVFRIYEDNLATAVFGLVVGSAGLIVADGSWLVERRRERRSSP